MWPIPIEALAARIRRCEDLAELTRYSEMKAMMRQLAGIYREMLLLNTGEKVVPLMSREPLSSKLATVPATAFSLLAKASQCRRLASCIVRHDDPAVATLLDLADQYDAMAAAQRSD